MARPARQRAWEHLPDIFGGVESISDAKIIRENGVFLLTDAAGNVAQNNSRGLGLYHADTRHLSAYDFTLNGAAPVVLLCSDASGYGLTQVLGNHKAIAEGRTIGRCTIEVQRTRVIGEALEERVHVTNYNGFPVTVTLNYCFDADFSDIFEIRGHKRRNPRVLLPPTIHENGITYHYQGLDGVMRRTTIDFDRAPNELTAAGAVYTLALGARESADIGFRIEVHFKPYQPGAVAHVRPSAHYGTWRDAFAFVHTSHEIFNQTLDRSLSDLRMLWTEEAQGEGYFAAGSPWFDTLFGRDSLITAMQTLPFRPQLARSCLSLLAKYQGHRLDTFSEEQPGKILHERRDDELSAVGELPYGRYYGSVDSTPLFLMLAAEYYHWTGDIETVRSLRPNLTAALHWVRHFGSPDADGYLKYHTSSPSGLRNQGWKDSEDSIVHEDGTILKGPVALAEVQAYLYAAYSRLAPLYEALGEPAEASRLRLDASSLRKRFLTDFWIEDQGLVPMALDGDGHPAAVMSSNAGQVLWGGILDAGRAEAVRDRLFANDMFSGWGIRTLSSESAVFNPLGYHLGTVWPHDNAIIAAGLKRYGFDDEAAEVATALFDTAQQFPSFRLPEVYGGHPRSAHQPPVPYPVACRPQAWAAGAMLHALSTVLGLVADAPRGKLYLVRPHLPYWLNEVRLRRLRVGDGSADLVFSRSQGRTRVHVEGARELSVVHVNSWPRA